MMRLERDALSSRIKGAMTEHRPPGMSGADLGRKHPAHPPPLDAGNRPVILFVTVCTDKRKPILANVETVAVILKAWRVADHWLVGRYVILPDHIHLFCAPGRHDHLPVQKWAAFWKSKVSNHWPDPKQHPIWQVDCWDTQLRRGENYSTKWEYVRNNPVRHGLVACAEEWPYQGELNIARLARCLVERDALSSRMRRAMTEHRAPGCTPSATALRPTSLCL